MSKRLLLAFGLLGLALAVLVALSPVEANGSDCGTILAPRTLGATEALFADCPSARGLRTRAVAIVALPSLAMVGMAVWMMDREGA